MSGRKLVTVREVAEIKPVKGADRIVNAIVDGWECIVPVNGFKQGDLAVFFEIDSFLPAVDPRWNFLQDKFITLNGLKGFRVKSMKMRGQVSQGLLQPLDKFPEILSIWVDLQHLHGKDEGTRLLRETALEQSIGVRKYEAEPTGGQPGIPSLPFPAFINKTDQERCQNLPGVFEKWKDDIFQERTKMDGSSMTVYFVRNDSQHMEQLEPSDPTTAPATSQPNGRFGVCSRNVHIPENREQRGLQFWTVAKRNNLPSKLSQLNRNIAIQGELCGSTIQKNFEGFPDSFHEFFVFSAWDLDEQKQVKPKNVEALVRDLGLRHVHVAGYNRLGDMATTVQELLSRAEGTGLNGRKREGIVLKHIDGGFSFKAISNSYLLKHGE